VADPDSSSSIAVSYESGSVCFTGNIDTAGWGAVYNFTLADENIWNAATRGVGGFELSITGDARPPELEVIKIQAIP